MKKNILFSLFVLTVSSLAAGEWVPLSQYHNIRSDITIVPDKYFFEAVGMLLALGFPQVDEATLLDNFNKLAISDQGRLAYTLRVSKFDERMDDLSYKYMRRGIRGGNLSDDLNKQVQQLISTFLNNLRTPQAAGEFYDYTRQIVEETGSDVPENEQLYIAKILLSASEKKLANATDDEKNEVIQFLIDTINNLTSNNARSVLTSRFIHHMSNEQLKSLNTTEYALLFAMGQTLYYNRFTDFIDIYYDLIQRKTDHFPDEELMFTFNCFFPGEKWESPREAIEFISKNPDAFEFDEETRTYKRK